MINSLRTTTRRAPDDAQPRSLYDLEGIGAKLADRIKRHYNDLRKEHEKYGSHDHLFTRLNAQPDLFRGSDELSEQEVLTLISFDPYRLREVRGINFKRADTIALQNYRIDPNDPRRHEAGNQSIVEQNGPLPVWKLRKEREKLLLRDPELETHGVILDHDLAWLPAELRAEEDLAHLFEDVLTSSNTLTPPDLSALDLGPLNADQARAVQTALSGTRVMALTGGAGTGKTRTTAAIAHAAKRLKKSMRVMAFAGKAAMRSQEAMGEDGVDWIECSTIHRALGLKGPYSHPNALEEDIIVLDESSMIPNWLMAKVVKAMRPTATLILVGDPNQLPPIGYGTPFQDYLSLGLPHVHLEINYRQAGQVSIHEFAEAIRQQNPNLFTPSESGVHLRFAINPADAESDFDTTIRHAAETLELHDWQVVTWKNDTRHGLNQHLQELLNPHGTGLFHYRLWGMKDEYGRDQDAEVRIGDKVLITDNDYNTGVFNGQTGVITALEHGELVIDFGPGEGERRIPLEDARDLMQLGYAVTVHKAQGSGWDTVILYQPEPVRFSPRRFYYTSVTRAKNAVHFFTTLTSREFWVNAMQADHDPDSTLLQRVHEAR